MQRKCNKNPAEILKNGAVSILAFDAILAWFHEEIAEITTQRSANSAPGVVPRLDYGNRSLGDGAGDGRADRRGFVSRVGATGPASR